jgi:hypothetical protein
VILNRERKGKKSVEVRAARRLIVTKNCRNPRERKRRKNIKDIQAVHHPIAMKNIPSLSIPEKRRRKNPSRNRRKQNIMESSIKTNTARTEYFVNVTCLSSNRNFTVGFRKLNTSIQKRCQNLK